MDNDILDVNEWILYAQGDYGLAIAMEKLRADNPYATNGACYHCQQSAEKILKAYTIAKEGTRVKEHDLNMLLKQCIQHSPDFDGLKTACLALNTHITKTRYPSGKKLTEIDMNEALQYAGQILEFTKSKLAEMGFDA